jgi:hypothetical protein
VVVAELTLETRRRTHVSAPDREGVVAYLLPHVLEGNPPEGDRPLVAEEVRLQLLARLVVSAMYPAPVISRPA